MAFPQESLSEGEEVRLHLHPHWITMFWPFFWLVVIIAGVGAGVFFSGANPVTSGAAGVAGLVLFIWLFLAPYIKWRTTHFVFTNRQVLWRRGVVRREERGIPLGRVNDVSSTQGLLERLIGAGTLRIESAGEHGQSELDDIPGVIKVMNTLKDLMEHDADKHSLDEDELRAALKEHREASGTV